MEIEYQITLNCFHGTIKHYADQVIQEKKFTIKRRDDHWLGNGVYFFINDREKAKWWSKEASKRANFNEELKAIAGDTTEKVIYLETTLNNRELLDLDTENGQKRIKDFIDYLLKRKSRITGIVSSGEEHKALCKILDLFAKTENVKATSYTFESNRKELFKGLNRYGIVNRGRQLSVYDQTIIDFKTLQIY